jgi:hypothetical protein
MAFVLTMPKILLKYLGRGNNTFIKHFFLLGHHNGVIYYLNTPLRIPY